MTFQNHQRRRLRIKVAIMHTYVKLRSQTDGFGMLRQSSQALTPAYDSDFIFLLPGHYGTLFHVLLPQDQP
ncbi:hypothetical protein pb186bvf_010525 [Paramecium bursaria]